VTEPLDEFESHYEASLATESQQFILPAPDGDALIPSASAVASEGLVSEALSFLDLRDLILDLFPEPGLQQAALTQLRNVGREILRGNTEEALDKARDLAAFARQKFETGRLLDPNGSAPPSTAEALAQFINGLYEFAGLPGGQLLDIQRHLFDSPLIDAIDGSEFPRGGSYLATVSGSGIEDAIGLLTRHASVFGQVVGSPGPGQITVVIWSQPVGAGETHLAPIPDVAFQLTAELSPGVPVVVGSGTFDIITVELDVLSAGNLQAFFVGCALCIVDFTGFSGSRFESTMEFTVSWDVPADYPWPDFGLGAGAWDGADQEDRQEILVPVVGPISP
jgi:hypothetical protein